MFETMADIVPEGESGHCKIEHFEVSKDDSKFTSMRAAITGHHGAYVREGRYCKLKVGHTLMMTDTQNEQDTNRWAVRVAQGDVFIAGLGIGMVLVPILKKESVRTVMVVEKEHSVIQLVKPHLMEHLPFEASRKLYMYESDVFNWKLPPRSTMFLEGTDVPTGMWDTIYFDIWANPCVDNLEEITKLKRRFARRFNRDTPGAWMGAWEEDRLRYLKRSNRWR